MLTSLCIGTTGLLIACAIAIKADHQPASVIDEINALTFNKTIHGARTNEWGMPMFCNIEISVKERNIFDSLVLELGQCPNEIISQLEQQAKLQVWELINKGFTWAEIREHQIHTEVPIGANVTQFYELPYTGGR